MNTLSIRFRISRGGSLIREVTLAQDVIKIGRMSSSHLRIDDETVSRMHAVIEVGEQGQVDIIDLGSAVGTRVNGKKINKSRLSSKDTIALGSVEIAVFFHQTRVAPALPPLPKGPGAQPSTSNALKVACPQWAPELPMAMGVPPALPQAARVMTRPAPFNLAELEDAASQAALVIAVWRDVVLSATVLKPGAKNAHSYCVGEDPSCDFPLSRELLGGETKLPVVALHEGGGAEIHFLNAAQGDITYEDGRCVPLAELVRSGQAGASSVVSGCYCLALPPSGRAKIDLGDFTFLAHQVSSPRKLVAPLQLDWQSQSTYLASALLHFLVVFLAFFDVSDALGLSVDFLDDANRMVNYDVVALEEKQEQEAPKEDRSAKGAEGQKHKLEEGQSGKREAPKTDNRFAIKGPPDNQVLRLPRDFAREAGILAYLPPVNAPVSPFGDTPLGADPDNALGALSDRAPGDSLGYGGLGVNGPGRGGGGTGEGTIGVDRLGTIGVGGGKDPGFGFDRGFENTRPSSHSVPRIRSGEATVKGSLNKEQIRRTVHRHINEVKHCYERELTKQPEMQGRVSIKFIILGSGAVQTSAVAETTLGNASVEHCIAQAVLRWTFPQPEGGTIVIVTYPFQLAAPQG